MTSPDITSRLSHTGQILVRSGIEIDRILVGIAKDRDTLSATLPSKVLFLSRVVTVDPVKQFMILSYSDHKPANTELLAARTVTFKCSHRGAQFAFQCVGPRTVMHERQPAIQLGMPTTMLALLPRRGVPRVQVPAEAKVDCELRMGMLAFDARLVDVSLDGMGFLLADDGMPLCAGTRLQGARVRHPRGEPLVVDIEIRHVLRVTLPDGKRATRIGCRIVAADPDLQELIRLFIIDLE